MFRRILPWGVVAAVAALAVPVIAAGPAPIDSGGTALEPAVPVSPIATDVVTIYNSRRLQDSVAAAGLQAARDAGGTAVIGMTASIGMRRVLRGSGVVQAAPSGFAYPMGTTVLPTGLVGRIMGRDVSGVLTDDTVVMSALTASLRGAQAGDRIELVASSGASVPMTIGAVVDDEITGGTELLMSPDAAAALGVDRPSRVVIWGFDSRADLDAALVANGLISTSIRVRRSWDPFDPDFTLGMAQSKAALGEFAFAIGANGSVTIDGAWKNANITFGSIGQLRLQTGCHQAIRPALQAAMDEVIASGLENTINYLDANTAGGCYNARFNRLTPDSSVGFLSRHTWGMAVDTNTVGSCVGCAPPDMDCRTVRIFRKHGFAWGGNFLRPDGMHFEWVGVPRDQFEYPSRFCANLPSGALQTPPTETARATMFSHDGLEAHGEEGH